jgi:protein tyrosine phosphatase (PTP) superfamily phosphohydrolase (DUF442 family)
MHDRLYLKISLLSLAALGTVMHLVDHGWRKTEPLPPAQRPVSWAQSLSVPGVENLFRVSQDLYRGEQPTADGRRNLERLGIRTFVNLRSFHSDREVLGNSRLNYEHITMKAWHPEEKEIVRFLKIVSDPGKTPVFVHCQHGSDRTGTMCAVYRMVIQGWSKDQAIEEMMRGGFGFHDIWTNLPVYLKNLDVDALRQTIKR